MTEAKDRFDGSSDQRPTVVQKYGGSSVATASHLRNVAARIAATREQGMNVVVVVSAMAATTDELLVRAKEVASAPSRRELDMLLSCGERISMSLLAMAVHELGYEAVSLTGSQSGIMTNDRHSGAQIIEVRPIRVQDELARGKVVIVAGFQGVSYKREITTLGRGGSDTTAVALAAALGAEYCEICSDVDGVYTADPRIVDAATLIDAIGSDEMLELAAHGARVLHPGCLQIARDKGVKLYARATKGDGAGTRIDPMVPEERAGAAGVTSVSGLVSLASEDSGALLQQVEELCLPILHTSQKSEKCFVLLSIADVPDWAQVRKVLVSASIDIEESLSLVSVVGNGIGLEGSKLRSFLSALRGEDLVQWHSSPLRISAVIRGEVEASLLCALHKAFVGDSK